MMTSGQQSICPSIFRPKVTCNRPLKQITPRIETTNASPQPNEKDQTSIKSNTPFLPPPHIIPSSSLPTKVHEPQSSASSQLTKPQPLSPITLTLPPKRKSQKPQSKPAEKPNLPPPLSINEIDYADPEVRANLPLSYFCSTSETSYHQFGSLTEAGIAAQASMKLYKEIRRRRQNRERNRTMQLAKATSEKDRHLIRRVWESQEQLLRNQEADELMGIKLVTPVTHHHPNRQPPMVDHQHGFLLSEMRTKNIEEDDVGEIMCRSDDDDTCPTVHLEQEYANDQQLLPSESDSSDIENGSLPVLEIINGVTVLRAPQRTVIQSNSQRAESSNTPIQVLEESDVRNRYYNQSKHGKGHRNRVSARWRPDEIDLFYTGLSVFGTNFEAIGSIIPGKTRVNIRNKYKAEMKLNPTRIHNALTSTSKLSIQQYADATGIDTLDLTQTLPKDVLDAGTRASCGSECVNQYIQSRTSQGLNSDQIGSCGGDLAMPMSPVDPFNEHGDDLVTISSRLASPQLPNPDYGQDLNLLKFELHSDGLMIESDENE